MSNIQVELLKETTVFTHNLIRKYSSLLVETDALKNFEIDGVKLNNLYWLTAHIAQTEDLLLAKAIGFKGHNYSWLESFGKDSSQKIITPVSYKELTQIAQEIHLNCMQNLTKLTDNDLSKDNKLGWSFGKDASIKAVINHNIRHFGIHAGHLSNLCKLNGIKTF